MTTEAPAHTFREVIAAELAEVREQIARLVIRADSLSDLSYIATRRAERTGNEPSMDDLLAAATDEQERAQLVILARRILTDEGD